jgi:hypothetical protein
MEPPSFFEVDDEIIIVDRNHRIVAARLDQTGSLSIVIFNAGLSQRTDDASDDATGERADCRGGKPTRRPHGAQPGNGQQAEPSQKSGGTAKGDTNSGACTRSTVCLCEKNSREEKVASEEITRASGRHAPSVNRCVATPPR